MDPVFAQILSSEESEVLAAYKENKTIQGKVDDDITIIEFTGTEPYYVAIDVSSGLYGIYDVVAGKWEAEPVYSIVGTYGSEELALAQKDGFYGFIDPMGNTVIGFQFVEADSFINGLARVCMNKRGIIDTNGTFVIDPIYEEVSIFLKNEIFHLTIT